MAEQNKGLAGIFNDPNFITGISILAANSDPTRHWSEGYRDASERLSAMERSALNRAEMELRKQKFEQEQQAMEAERQRAAGYQKAVQSFGPETSISEQINALLPYTTPGQGANLLQSLAGMQEGPNKTSLIQNYEYFAEQEKAAGRTPPSLMEFAQKQADIQRSAKVGQGLKTAVLPGGGRGYIIPETKDFLRDEFGNIIQAPGSVQEKLTGQELERQYNWPETERTFKSRMSDLDQSLDSVQEVRNTLEKAGPLPVTGAGSLLSRLPGSAANNLKANIDTLRADIGFAELQRMRDNSPTGGALGQVTERELQFLQNSIASLEQSQSREQFEANLRRVESQIAKSKAAINQAYQEDLRRFGPGQMPAQPGGAQGGASNIDDLVNKYGGQ